MVDDSNWKRPVAIGLINCGLKIYGEQAFFFNDLYGFGQYEFCVFDASWLRLREVADQLGDGRSVEDIAAMRLATDGTKTTIKASGGIRSLEAAIMMAKAGATRIGSSSTVAILDGFRALKN